MTKEELEKEAEKWLRKFLLCNDCKRKCHCIELNAYCEEQVLKAYIDSAEPREKRIAELEKENAELKKQLEMSNKVYNDNLDYSHHIEEQLTKAKEIIKDLLNLPFASNEEVFADVGSHLYKAEQFLSEVEK